MLVDSPHLVTECREGRKEQDLGGFRCLMGFLQDCVSTHSVTANTGASRPRRCGENHLKNYPRNGGHRTLGSFSSSRLKALWANLRSRPTFTAIDARAGASMPNMFRVRMALLQLRQFPQLMERWNLHTCVAQRSRKHNPEGRKAGGLYRDIC